MTGYTHEQLVEATKRALQGEQQTDLSRIYNVPYRSLKLYIKRMRDTGSIVPKRRGPPPVLPTQCEERLQTWIKYMQTNGYPIKRHDLLVKVAEICNARGIPELAEGWFLKRHPLITQRQAQVISRVRNEVDVNGIRTLFFALAKLIIEERLDGHRLYNMDKTVLPVMVRALALRILLVCLPANGTHLVQPLDVAVFGPFKKVFRQDILNFMVAPGPFTISKKNAVELASAA
ncbi:hypothetical protein DYB26_016545 [Aphanomyces astaci]|uniref:DDE-1 domain-containing protein n=1 Tax=Aphanomyces astaci TaxID=112090 RepID=A0A397FQT5_APHAT|nr:hypothetical protein DYB31_012615 [Aphanomyces astaci]RHZ42192.1 hypothetical protein DYB26_016545 [Aphanomyces astaci]